MSYRYSCYTLFNINKTGVLNRARPNNDVIDIQSWYLDRNTQCNLDTILQVISLRAQPENISDPILTAIYDYKFGTNYTNLEKCWKFEFEIQQDSVFDDGLTNLGHLYKDCDNVPMLLIGDEPKMMTNHLDISKEWSNIFFVKY
jgi:hypothetical protein